jgi:hypothetical protein
MRILAIDPGTDKSGWCEYDTAGVVNGSGVMDNIDLLRGVRYGMTPDVLAIEMVASYGMPVGREVFETVLWTGRFFEAWDREYGEAPTLVYRKDVKLHLCGSPKAKDPNVRQSILDRFPRTGGGATSQIGTKSKPGPLYGISTHAWAALAVALYVADRTATGVEVVR